MKLPNGITLSGTFGKNRYGDTYLWKIDDVDKRDPCGCEGCKGSPAGPGIVCGCTSLSLAAATPEAVEEAMNAQGIKSKTLRAKIQTTVKEVLEILEITPGEPAKPAEKPKRKPRAKPA